MAIAPVAAQATGKSVTNAQTTTIAYPGNVTSGNTLIVRVVSLWDVFALGAVTVTKSSGTATIGAATTDKTFSSSFSAVLDVIRIPITGSGSLTLSIDIGTGSNNGFIVIGINEYTNFHATPVDGTPVSNTSTGSTESTGAVSAHAGGLVVMVAAEASTGNFTYASISDTVVFKSENGSTDLTGIVQDKLIASDSSPSISEDTGNSWDWAAIAVAYLPVAGGVTPAFAAYYQQHYRTQVVA